MVILLQKLIIVTIFFSKNGILGITDHSKVVKSCGTRAECGEEVSCCFQFGISQAVCTYAEDNPDLMSSARCCCQTDLCNETSVVASTVVVAVVLLLRLFR